MNEKAPGRFKFSCKEKFDFNAEIIVDIIFLDGRNVLHVVDSAIAFQAARFIKDLSAKTVWEAIRLCWIDVYQGPPDDIVHDAGTQLASAEFKQEAKIIGSKTKEVPIEAHQSVGKVERYHVTLRRAYEVIKGDLPNTSREAILQMVVKAINDIAGPNSIVLTLLVFGAFPRLTEESSPSPSIVRRAEFIHNATKEVTRLYAQRMRKNALKIRNGPDVGPILNLPLQSLVQVWREKEGWTGPFRLLSTEGQTCTIDMPRGPRNFYSTVVRPHLA
ncbi:hypothetical protein K3495_g735 [Podosphaera aphanis]|nr:hypothetical protein K3495_g735 [Podosphaera aphanis]